MRKRFQNGRVVKSTDGRYWIGKWREDGHDRSKVLGKVSKMTKSKAREDLVDIVTPINERSASAASKDTTVKDFIEKVFLPFYRRKWKRVTIESRTDSITRHRWRIRVATCGFIDARRIAEVPR